MGYWHDFCAKYGLDPDIEIQAADYHYPQFLILDQQLQDFVGYLSQVTTATGTLRHKTIQGHLNGLARVTQLQLGIDILASHPMYKWVMDGVKHCDEAKGLFPIQEDPLMTMMLVWGDSALNNSPFVRASLWVATEFELRVSECVATKSCHYPIREGTKFVKDDCGRVIGMSLLIPSSKESAIPVTRRIMLTDAFIAICVACGKSYERQINNPVYICWRCDLSTPKMPERLRGIVEPTLMVYEVVEAGRLLSHVISETINCLKYIPPLRSDQPLFPMLNPSKTICGIRSLVKYLGLQPERFGNQSTRRGGACDMVALHRSDSAIEVFGRWRSGTWKTYYAAMILATADKIPNTETMTTEKIMNPCEE
jgi:hypothetical protein